MFSSTRHPKYSKKEYCLILFSFLEMFKEGYCLFPLLNKIHLVLSSPKCICSLLSINNSRRLSKSVCRCFSIELIFSLLKRMQVHYLRVISSCNRLQLISYHLRTIKKYWNQNGLLRDSTI